MQLYKTIIRNANNDLVAITWQGSQIEAAKARAAAKRDGCRAVSEHVNIPTDKRGLLGWLNETN